MFKIVDSDVTAYIYSFLAYFFFYLSLVFAAQNQKINFANFNLWRGLGLIIFNYLTASSKSIKFQFKKQREFKLLNARCILNNVHIFATAFSLHYLPQPLIQTISCSVPIIVFILDYYLNNIGVTKRQLYGIISTCLSIVMVINSDIIMWYLGYEVLNQSKYKYTEVSIFLKALVSFVFFISTIFQASAILITKKIKCYSNQEINFNNGFQSIMIGVLMSFYFQTPYLNAYESIYAFVTIGAFCALSQLFYIPSLMLTKKLGNVTILAFTKVLLGYFTSILIYNQPANMIGMIGSVMLLIGLYFVLIK